MSINPQKIFGRIKIVDSFEDYKVKVVSQNADIDVRKVSSNPSSPGEWHMVESSEDFKIKIVDSFEDFTVKFI